MVSEKVKVKLVAICVLANALQVGVSCNIGDFSISSIDDHGFWIGRGA